MDNRYSLDVVIAQAQSMGLRDDELTKIRWAYLDTAAAYERRVPYSAERLPGIQGVCLYELNKSIVAYSSGVRELRRIVDSIQRGSE